MVPKDETNWAKAFTPANPALEIKFRVMPESFGTTVTPNTTHQSPETLGVSSPIPGDSQEFDIGAGNAFSPAPLRLSVKKYQTKPVTIHAVTQRYGPNDHMSLQSGDGIANVLCAKEKPDATIKGFSNKGGDDHLLADGSFDTGDNGVCETNADPRYYDVLIPAGSGIHKDISPSGKPTAATLKGYLDRVFGVQTNTYIVVVEGAPIIANYDINKNKLLDVLDSNGLTSQEEDSIIVNRGEPYHIYYVKDFITYRSGTSSHDAAGATHSSDSFRLTFLRDGTWNMLNLAAHEIGHLLKLNHSDEENLSSGAKNPTYQLNPDPKKRLMHSRYQQEAPILLIKSEWDIINSNRQ